MRGQKTRTIAIVGPFMLAIAAILWAMFNLAFGDFDGKIQSIGISIMSFPIKGDAIHFVVMMIGGLALLFFAFFRDYSGVFPNKLAFAVYFDVDGMKRILDQTRKPALEQINISANWIENSGKFQTRLIRQMKSKMGVAVDRQAIDRISARGITTFIVSKESRAFQSYTISEIDGYLTFDLPLKDKSHSLRSFFQLNNSPRDHFNVSIKEIIIDWMFQINPLMKQTYLTGPSNEIVIENVIALTCVRIFPLVDIGDTLYLAKDGEDYLPIGYCSYRQ